jgi:hypothetical protein
MYVCFVLNNTFSAVIQSTPLRQAYGTDNDISPMLYFSFYELVYYLVDNTQEDGQRFRTRIVECISDHESNVRRSDNHVKFRISINEDEYEEIITYNELLDYIEKNQENDAIMWQF